MRAASLLLRPYAVAWDQTAATAYRLDRVLTMEWIEGVKLTDKQAMDRANLSIIDFVDVRRSTWTLATQDGTSS